MWNIKERKAYNEAIEKEVLDKKIAKAKMREDFKLSYKTSLSKVTKSHQTPKEREVLHAILKVTNNTYDVNFVKSCINRKTLTKAQRTVLNKIYIKYKNLI